VKEFTFYLFNNINTEGLLQSCVSSRGLCKNLVTPGGPHLTG